MCSNRRDKRGYAKHSLESDSHFGARSIERPALAPDVCRQNSELFSSVSRTEDNQTENYCQAILIFSFLKYTDNTR